MGCGCLTVNSEFVDDREHVVIRHSTWGVEVFGPYKGFQKAQKKVDRLQAVHNSGHYLYSVQVIQDKKHL